PCAGSACSAAARPPDARGRPRRHHLAFDDARIAEPDVRALAALSPHLTRLAVAPPLERCVVGEPAYLECTRSTASPRFLWNARVNLETTKLAFYRSRDLTILEARYEESEPGRGCGPSVAAVVSASTRGRPGSASWRRTASRSGGSSSRPQRAQAGAGSVTPAARAA